MGYDLRSRTRYGNYTSHLFVKFYEQAVGHGWQPAGSVPVDEYEFQRRIEAVGETEAIAEACAARARDTIYLSNDWKIITRKDAMAFAAALRHALAGEKPDGAAGTTELVALIQLLEDGPVLLS